MAIGPVSHFVSSKISAQVRLGLEINFILAVDSPLFIPSLFFPRLTAGYWQTATPRNRLQIFSPAIILIERKIYC